jgi:hypothetical protein
MIRCRGTHQTTPCNAEPRLRVRKYLHCHCDICRFVEGQRWLRLERRPCVWMTTQAATNTDPEGRLPMLKPHPAPATPLVMNPGYYNPPGAPYTPPCFRRPGLKAQGSFIAMNGRVLTNTRPCAHAAVRLLPHPFAPFGRHLLLRSK